MGLTWSQNSNIDDSYREIKVYNNSKRIPQITIDCTENTTCGDIIKKVNKKINDRQTLYGKSTIILLLLG